MTFQVLLLYTYTQLKVYQFLNPQLSQNLFIRVFPKSPIGPRR
jgi:hypothetical protein